VLPPPLADVTAKNHESPRKFLIVSETQSTITGPQTSAAMTFHDSDFIMELERHVP
jgi:hypothetical protein